MYLIFLLSNILKTCKWIHKPPKEIIIQDKIVLISILILDKLKYFNPWVISIKPYINLKLLLIKKVLLINVVIIIHVVIIPSINKSVFDVFIIDLFKIFIKLFFFNFLLFSI